MNTGVPYSAATSTHTTTTDRQGAIGQHLGGIRQQRQRNRRHSPAPRSCHHGISDSGRLDAEQIEACGEHPRRLLAQLQPLLTRRIVGLQHRTGLVERRECLRQFEQVGAQAMRAELVERVLHGRIELQQTQDEIAFLRDEGNVRCVGAPPPPPPLRRIERIRAWAYCRYGAGVALEGEHAIPVEDVVLDPIGRQVGVLQRADARPSGRSRSAPRLGQVWVLLEHGCRGPLDRLVDDVDELAPVRRFGSSASCGRCPARSRRRRALRASAVAATRPSRPRRRPSTGAAIALPQRRTAGGWP